MAHPTASPAATVSGIVLAGGRGRRLGGVEKGLQALAGRPLIAHVIDRVAPQVAALAINANSIAAGYAALGLPLVADTLPGRPGPLAGVLAGLEWMRGPGWLLSVPCDAPFLPPDLAARLCAVADNAEVACAASGGRLHPVCALWRHDLAPALRAALADGRNGVEAFVRGRRLAVAEFAGDPDPFLNVNTPEDLARAQGRLR
jgi:molybdopterin-guanine dinucleotide biosynthesis protein A